MLMMYYWPHELNGDEDYWQEYQDNTCLTYTPVN